MTQILTFETLFSANTFIYFILLLLIVLTIYLNGFNSLNIYIIYQHKHSFIFQININNFYHIFDLIF
jgi:hypothetical protein